MFIQTKRVGILDDTRGDQILILGSRFILNL